TPPAAATATTTAARPSPRCPRHADHVPRSEGTDKGMEGVIDVSCITAHDPQLARLADAIAQRVGPQRFHVWFNNSTRLDLKHDGLEIAVPNDFISEWIGTHFTKPIQEAAHEVLGCPLIVRFNVVPQLFEVESKGDTSGGNGGIKEEGRARAVRTGVAGTMAPMLGLAVPA